MNSDDSPLLLQNGDALSLLNCHVFPTHLHKVKGNMLIPEIPEPDDTDLPEEESPITAWRAKTDAFTCVKEGGYNTGYKTTTVLEQYVVSTGEVTGVTKANVFGAADYIEPVYDDSFCHVDEQQDQKRTLSMYYVMIGGNSFSVTAARAEAWDDPVVVNWEYQYTNELGGISIWLDGATPINIQSGEVTATVTETIMGNISTLDVRPKEPIPDGYEIG